MTPKDEPTTAHILAAIAGIALTGRKLAAEVDASDPLRVREMLDALHEHLAVAGGSALFIARRLGCEAEVERLVDPALADREIARSVGCSPQTVGNIRRRAAA